VKILVLSNLYPPQSIGGYEERCRQTCDQLRARGHVLRVLTSDHGLPAPADDGTVARTLRIHGFFGHPWLPPHRLFGLERHNHAQLRGLIAGFQPDIVHVWNLGGLSKSLILTLQAWGGPVTYDVSDHWIARSLRADVWLRWWNGEAGGLLARALRGVLRGTGLDRFVRRAAPFAPWSEIRFPHIYFCSAALREITVAAGWPVAHAAVIYCGVETARFTLRPDSPRCERLLYVGRLADDKDPLTALRAVARLRARGEPVTLDLYGGGGGDYRRQLEAEATRPELAGAVQFRSAAAEAMPAVYAQYDALLFTSAWEEPFALTPLEAMASGLPVIGTPSGGSRELFRDGDNALVFPARDDAALAAAIDRLRTDPLLRTRMAQRSLTEVRARYDLPGIVTEIENFLRENAHGR
jgi:glycosyltransferase involved in cell wall biosynthesis